MGDAPRRSRRMPLRRAVKTAHRIGAEERERELAAELRPELLQAYGRVRPPVVPEQGDHFAERPDAAPAAARRAFDHASDDVGETALIGSVVAHELGEAPDRVEGDEPTLAARAAEVEPIGGEPVGELLSMRFGGDDHGGVTRAERGADVPRDRIDQENIAVVELDQVGGVGGRGIAPVHSSISIDSLRWIHRHDRERGTTPGCTSPFSPSRLWPYLSSVFWRISPRVKEVSDFASSR